MIVDLIWNLVLAVLSLSLVLVLFRLVRGPWLPDRVIALDLVTILVMGFIVVTAIRFNQPAFLDVAIILALIAFIGTVAFAYYIERRI